MYSGDVYMHGATFTLLPLITPRQCATSSFYIINGLHYCPTTCAATTMCGQAKVPASHLQVNGMYTFIICGGWVIVCIICHGVHKRV